MYGAHRLGDHVPNPKGLGIICTEPTVSRLGIIAAGQVCTGRLEITCGYELEPLRSDVPSFGDSAHDPQSGLGTIPSPVGLVYDKSVLQNHC